MSNSMNVLVYLALAGLLLWIRHARAKQSWQRTLLLVLAVLLAYPAVNLCYIAAKRFFAG